MEKDEQFYHTITSNNKDSANQSRDKSIKNNDIPLMDELINSYGYSRTHYKTIVFTCLILFIDGIHMTLLNSTFIPFQKYYELSETQVGLISSTMFLAVGCGSLLTLFPQIIGSRRNALIRFNCLIFIFNFFLGIFPFLSSFIILRILIGMCIGVLLPLIINLLCENLPIKNRSFTMISSGIFFSFGAIFVNILMYFFTPNLEKEGLYTIFFILSFVPLIVAAIFYFYLEESPRSLILSNNQEEAFIILEKMIAKKLSNNEKEIITSQVKSGANQHVDSKLSNIFEGKFKKITIILILIWMFNSYLAYGGTITFSLVLKRIKETNSKEDTPNTKNSSSIIFNQIMVYLISAPGTFVAGYMTEIKIFGRKMTTLIGFLFIAIFATLAIFDVPNFSIYFSISGFFISFSFHASGTYSSEVYPTKLRNIAVGFLNFCTRVAGFFSQFAAVQLFRIYYLGQIYFSVAICIIACFITYSLPYDTHGRALDNDSIEDEKNNVDEKKIQAKSISDIELTG